MGTEIERTHSAARAATPKGERIGIAVISAWTEGHGSVVRVRVTTTRDLTSEGRIVSAVVRREVVADLIGAWLDGLLAGDAAARRRHG